jgi:V/A-type H+/Na+-transporting ATPase subunit E
MGYQELLQALGEEVGRQVRELRTQTSRERQELLDATRRELEARRGKVLEEERRRLKEESARAVSRARLEQARTLLVEMRRQMTELRQEAEARLPAANCVDLLTRLVDEVVPELGEGPVEFRVEEGHEEALRRHLDRHHPRLVRRATVTGSRHVQGGVMVSLGGRELLDNTLPSRLAKAWEDAETEIATILFGEGDDER